MYTAKDIAIFFLRAVDRPAGDTISPLKLQKLLYFAQGHYLAKYDKPLFNDDFEAWLNGPAIRKVWNEYKDYKGESIPMPKCCLNTPDFDDNTMDFLDKIYKVYGKYSGSYLKQLTNTSSPCIDNYDRYDEYHDKIIPKEDIKKYFNAVNSFVVI